MRIPKAKRYLFTILLLATAKCFDVYYLLLKHRPKPQRTFLRFTPHVYPIFTKYRFTDINSFLYYNVTAEVFPMVKSCNK